MPSLTKSKPVDALGQPIDPGQTYTPLSAHGRVVNGAPRSFSPDIDKLLGSHEAVQAAPALWIPITTPSDVKTAARKARHAAAAVVPTPDRRHILEPRPIALERLALVAENFEWRGTFYRVGSRFDVGDAVVAAAPQWFRRADNSPLPKQAA